MARRRERTTAGHSRPGGGRCNSRRRARLSGWRRRAASQRTRPGSAGLLGLSRHPASTGCVILPAPPLHPAVHQGLLRREPAEPAGPRRAAQRRGGAPDRALLQPGAQAWRCGVRGLRGSRGRAAAGRRRFPRQPDCLAAACKPACPQEAHIARLRANLDTGGDGSLQNGLDLAVDSLKAIPPYGHRCVLTWLLWDCCSWRCTCPPHTHQPPCSPRPAPPRPALLAGRCW